jgi:hypothetical protein
VLVALESSYINSFRIKQCSPSNASLGEWKGETTQLGYV